MGNLYGLPQAAGLFQHRSMDFLANAQIDFTVITFIWDYDLSKRYCLATSRLAETVAQLLSL